MFLRELHVAHPVVLLSSEPLLYQTLAPVSDLEVSQENS
jgi:hypothetical protein